MSEFAALGCGGGERIFSDRASAITDNRPNSSSRVTRDTRLHTRPIALRPAHPSPHTPHSLVRLQSAASSANSLPSPVIIASSSPLPHRVCSVLHARARPSSIHNRITLYLTHDTHSAGNHLNAPAHSAQGRHVRVEARAADATHRHRVPDGSPPLTWHQTLRATHSHLMLDPVPPPTHTRAHQFCAPVTVSNLGIC